MKYRFLPPLFVLACGAIAQTDKDHPSGPRMTPPTIASVTPLGAARGTTTELTVEGLNLAGANAVYFSHPGVKGRIVRVKELPDGPDIRLGANGTPSTIDVGPLPPRNQVTIEIDVEDPAAIVQPVSFRIRTPLGTSPEGRFLLEPYYGESADREPNDSIENASEAFVPTILTGVISRPGDLDFFKLTAKAGDELVFDNAAVQIGSTLQTVVAIYDGGGQLLKEYGREGGLTGAQFAHRFEKDGTYYARISDYENAGRGSSFYRIRVGKYGLVTSVYPIGVPAGKATDVALTGFHLKQPVVKVDGKPAEEDPYVAMLRPEARGGAAFNALKLQLGQEPEVEAGADGSTQKLQLPVTVNGKLTKPEHRFRFTAAKGERLIFEVTARRFGSELDSFLEIQDVHGKPVPLAVARAVWETFTVLAERDSVGRGIRIQNWNALAVGDYVMIGNEIIRMEALPKSPDDDAIFEGFGGQRIGFFGTTTEAHALDKPVYKVQIHPPDARFAPNGLPQVKLFYRNDDGGPGFGRDSYLVFDAPVAGEYDLVLRDVRGMSGEKFSYRLTARLPRSDFRLSANPRNPNVPVGGTIPVTVTAQRMDGFDGPIEVVVEGLPAGLRATRGLVAKGQVNATILLSAESNAKLVASVPLRVVGRAAVNGREIVRLANAGDPLQLISLAPPPDVRMTAETREVVVEAGGTADVWVSIARQNGFKGRVPVEVRNLPPSIRVLDVGLNGVLLNEDETRRSFTLEALPHAEPLEQLVFVSGQVETRSPQQNSFASEVPVLLKIKPRGSLTSAAQSNTTPAGAPQRQE